jgi:hypothetical protein
VGDETASIGTPEPSADRFPRAPTPSACGWVTRVSCEEVLVTHPGDAPARAGGFDREGPRRTGFDQTDQPPSPGAHPPTVSVHGAPTRGAREGGCRPAATRGAGTPVEYADRMIAQARTVTGTAKAGEGRPRRCLQAHFERGRHRRADGEHERRAEADALRRPGELERRCRLGLLGRHHDLALDI